MKTTTPVKGDDVDQYMEADIPGYYHRITFTNGEDMVAFEFRPTYKDDGAGNLVSITREEADWAWLNLRVESE